MSTEHTIVVPADHPALAGHFPGNPVVPGAVLLDAALAALRQSDTRRISGIATAKFPAPLRPDTPCQVQITRREAGTLRLSCTVDGVTVLTATVELAEDEAPSPGR